MVMVEDEVKIEQHYSVKTVAELLDIHEERLRRLIRDGELCAVKLSDRRTRIPESELKRWIAQRRSNVASSP